MENQWWQKEFLIITSTQQQQARSVKMQITCTGSCCVCSSSSLAGIFLFLFCTYHYCPCHEAKLRTPPCNWYIIASLLCHFSSSAPLDPLPVSLDVESSRHNGLALEKHGGVCNYTRLWLPLVWSSLFNSHYMETLLWTLFNGPLAQFSFAPQPAAAVKLSDQCWSIDRVVHTARPHTQTHTPSTYSFFK